jgi:hypothetical protein
MTYFDVLGIPPDAEDDAVATAYHRLARELHPDAHPAATAHERAAYQARMAELNLAYDTLKDARRRTEYLRSLRLAGGARESHGTTVPCALCGETPAERVKFSSGRGAPRWTANLCPRCTRTVVAPTPVQGTYDLARHGRRLRLAASLALTVTVLALGGIAVRSFRENLRTNYAPLNESAGSLTSVLTTRNEWLANGCVSMPTTPVSLIVPVGCGQPHDGRIIARVTRADDCPAETDELHYEPTINSVVCIETAG